MALPPQLRQAGGGGLLQEELQAGSLESRDPQALLLTFGSGTKGLCELHQLLAYSGILLSLSVPPNPPSTPVLSQEVGG